MGLDEYLGKNSPSRYFPQRRKNISSEKYHSRTKTLTVMTFLGSGSKVKLHWDGRMSQALSSMACINTNSMKSIYFFLFFVIPRDSFSASLDLAEEKAQSVIYWFISFKIISILETWFNKTSNPSKYQILTSPSRVKGLLEERKCELWLSIENKNVKKILVFLCRQFLPSYLLKNEFRKTSDTGCTYLLT